MTPVKKLMQSVYKIKTDILNKVDDIFLNKQEQYYKTRKDQVMEVAKKNPQQALNNANVFLTEYEKRYKISSNTWKNNQSTETAQDLAQSMIAQKIMFDTRNEINAQIKSQEVRSPSPIRQRSGSDPNIAIGKKYGIAPDLLNKATSEVNLVERDQYYTNRKQYILDLHAKNPAEASKEIESFTSQYKARANHPNSTPGNVVSGLMGLKAMEDAQKEIMGQKYEIPPAMLAQVDLKFLQQQEQYYEGRKLEVLNFNEKDPNQASMLCADYSDQYSARIEAGEREFKNNPEDAAEMAIKGLIGKQKMEEAENQITNQMANNRTMSPDQKFEVALDKLTQSKESENAEYHDQRFGRGKDYAFEQSGYIREIFEARDAGSKQAAEYIQENNLRPPSSYLKNENVEEKAVQQTEQKAAPKPYANPTKSDLEFREAKNDLETAEGDEHDQQYNSSFSGRQRDYSYDKEDATRRIFDARESGSKEAQEYIDYRHLKEPPRGSFEPS